MNSDPNPPPGDGMEFERLRAGNVSITPTLEGIKRLRAGNVFTTELEWKGYQQLGSVSIIPHPGLDWKRYILRWEGVNHLPPGTELTFALMKTEAFS